MELDQDQAIDKFEDLLQKVLSEFYILKKQLHGNKRRNISDESLFHSPTEVEDFQVEGQSQSSIEQYVNSSSSSSIIPIPISSSPSSSNINIFMSEKIAFLEKENQKLQQDLKIHKMALNDSHNRLLNRKSNNNNLVISENTLPELNCQSLLKILNENSYGLFTVKVINNEDLEIRSNNVFECDNMTILIRFNIGKDLLINSYIKNFRQQVNSLSYVDRGILITGGCLEIRDDQFCDGKTVCISQGNFKSLNRWLWIFFVAIRSEKKINPNNFPGMVDIQNLLTDMNFIYDHGHQAMKQIEQICSIYKNKQFKPNWVKMYNSMIELRKIYGNKLINDYLKDIITSQGTRPKRLLR